MSDPASQLRIQDSKEKLQQAYSYAVSAKQEAESNFKQEEDAGITDGQNFNQWTIQNVSLYKSSSNGICA